MMSSRQKVLADGFPTWQQAREEQEELATLCIDRALETEEIFEGNAFYGNDTIVKAYSGWNRPLKVVIPHSICLVREVVWDAELRAELPAMFYYRLSRKHIFEEKGSLKVQLPSASPFLYLHELLKERPPPTRNGTLFFPAHSTHHVNVDMDFTRLADMLEGLDDEFQPVSVCIFWKDYLLGRHEVFQKRGLHVVSAGHMYDPLFLFRLYYLCAKHRYTASNSLGSHIFFSLAAGCSFFYIESPIVKTKLTKFGEITHLSGKKKEKLKKMFATARHHPSAEQLARADNYLGRSFLQPPQGVRRQLRYAERLDWTPILEASATGKRRIILPRALKRLPRELKSWTKVVRRTVGNHLKSGAGF